MKKHRGLVLLLVLLVCLVPISSPVMADLQVVRGTDAAPAASPPVQPGFPVVLNGSSTVFLSGLTAYDLDGDGKQELLFATRELDPTNTVHGGYGCRGLVYAIKPDGTIFWKATVRAGVDSTPAITGDLNGDGKADVVVGMGAYIAPGETAANECGKSNPDQPGNGGLVALNGQNGAVLWTFSTADKGEWGVPNNGVRDGVFSAPASADIVPGSPGPEIVFGGWDNCIYLLNKDGKPLWGVAGYDYSEHPASAGQCGYHGFLSGDTVWSSPALADLDGDGRIEIIIGGDVSDNWYKMPNGGVVWVIGPDGSILAQKSINQTIYSSPAIADVDGDGKPDIVIGTGDYWCDGGAKPVSGDNCATGKKHAGAAVYVMGYDRTKTNPQERLTIKQQLATVGPTRSAPAVGDLNLDGFLDIVALAKYDNGGPQNYTVGQAQSTGSYLYVWNGKTGQLLSGFPAHICDSVGTAFPVSGSPIIADIAGDAKPEILFSHSNEVSIFSANGQPYTRVNENRVCYGYPQPGGQTNLIFSSSDRQGGAMTTTPLVLDLDGDGRLEVASVAATQSSLTGRVWVWKTDKNGATPWPMFRRDPSHTAVYMATPVLGNKKLYLPIVTRSGSPSTTSVFPVVWTRQSFRLNGGQVILSAPILVDLDGGDQEVLVGTSPLTCTDVGCTQTAPTLLVALRSNGALFWQADTGGNIPSAPAAGDIAGTSAPEVVVSVGSSDPAVPLPNGGSVKAYSNTGAPLWTFSPRLDGAKPASVTASPTLCDLDNDGKHEVVFGAGDGYVYALRGNGTKLWEYENLWPIIFSTAACADVNGDGNKEVLVGTYCTTASQWCYGNNGYLLVLDRNGNKIASRGLNQVPLSSPDVGDINRDGRLEVIIGTSNVWTSVTSYRLYAFDASQTTLPDVPGWPVQTTYPVMNTPALADLDNDGYLEVLVAATDLTQAPTPPDDIPGTGVVEAFRYTGQRMPGWPVRPKMYADAVTPKDGPILGSPTAADLDGDGYPEVLISSLRSVYLYRRDGSAQQFPTSTLYNVYSAPAVGDTNGDGKVEVWIGGSHAAGVEAFDPLEVGDATRGYLWKFTADFAGFGALSWPMYRQNPQNTGQYR